MKRKYLLKSAFLFTSILSTVWSFSQSVYPMPNGNATVYKLKNPTISIQGEGNINYADSSILELNPYVGRPGGSPTKIAGIDNMKYSADLGFFTAPSTWDNRSIAAIERMRVTSLGNVIMGNPLSRGKLGIGNFDDVNPPAAALHIATTGYPTDDAWIELQRRDSNAANMGLVMYPVNTQKLPLSNSNKAWGYGVWGGTNDLRMWNYNGSTNGNNVFLTVSGNTNNVGIGTMDPVSKLHVQGSASFGDSITTGNATRALNIVDDSAVIRIARISATAAPSVELISRKTKDGSNLSYWDFCTEPTDASFKIRERMTTPSKPLDMITIARTTGNIGIIGSVGIGTTNLKDTAYKLFVEKGIRTRKVKVDQDNWPDYVFSSSYKLRSLAELENFIKENNHLPDVPSAQKVEKEGVDIGSTQAALLKKIEELTLYMLQQAKKVETLEKEISQLKSTK